MMVDLPGDRGNLDDGVGQHGKSEIKFSLQSHKN